MAASRPLVSIVILNWNGLEDTKVCLDHVRKLDYSNYEVIVVDNGSRPEEKQYLSQLEDIVYVNNPVNRGFAGGQTDGYKIAKGEFILLLNNDAVIKHDYLREALPLFDNPDVAVVGGRAYFWNEKAPLLDESNPFYAYMEVDPFSAETTMLTRDHGIVQEVNNVSGSAVLVRRTAIDKVGYLYEPFFAYYEETDLFARMKRAGYKVLYSPKLRIWHRNGASSGAQGGSSFFYYHIFRNRFMFVLRNFEPEFIAKFLRHYYGWAWGALWRIPASANDRRLGLAYLKAIAATLVRLITVLWSRRQLTKKLGKTNYCRQVADEHLKISIVIDATRISKAKLDGFISLAENDPNPLHEYIAVTKDDQKVPLPNLKLIIDRGYFDCHPINLGCITAKSSWLIIAASDNLPDVAAYHALISQNITRPYKLFTIGGAPSIAIAKSYYQKMGGLQTSSEHLGPNLEFARQYADLEGKGKHYDQPKHGGITNRTAIAKQITRDNFLLRQRSGSTWQRMLAKYYRLYQLNNLLRWTVNPKVPIRLKLARTKNLLLFTTTLRRVPLATELRHIRNEAELYSSRSIRTFSDAEQQQIVRATTNLLHGKTEISVFIICFERVEALKQLVTWLEKAGLKKIVFIDNDSSYAPLLDYYAAKPYQLLPLGQNIGHTAPWSLDIIRILAPAQYYIVSDPDVIPAEECPPDVVAHLAEIHQSFPARQKVGLGLKIDDLPDHYPLKNEVTAWEKQFWQTKVTPDIYEAGVDTTFALYKPFTYHYTLHPSLRTGEPYVARHLPWYADPAKLSAEDIYYAQHANTNITSWSTDVLPERYQKELEK